ncbi:MAG: hypothetical protein FJW30_05415, partial [Acidobacteria bacterium]|nr:hypothetical protein [Acidobacteriota bacterium]
MTPEELDLLAKDLHHEWESPDLWRRIESRRRQRAWAAAAVILAACLALALLLPRPAAQRAPDRAGGPLLSDDAFAEVAAAEKAYLRSIERLSRAAEGKLRGAKSPV